MPTPDRDSLTVPQLATLAAIVRGRVAWTPLAKITATFGGDVVDELVGLELVAVWVLDPLKVDERRFPDGLVMVTLAPIAASMLGVEIDERDNADEDPFWLESSPELDPDGRPLPRRSDHPIVMPPQRGQVRAPLRDSLPARTEPIEIEEVEPEPIERVAARTADTDEPIVLWGREVVRRGRAG